MTKRERDSDLIDELLLIGAIRLSLRLQPVTAPNLCESGGNAGLLRGVVACRIKRLRKAGCWPWEATRPNSYGRHHRRRAVPAPKVHRSSLTWEQWRKKAAPLLHSAESSSSIDTTQVSSYVRDWRRREKERREATT